MKEYILRMLENSKSLTIEDMLLNLAVATVVAGAIYLSYYISHAGSVYSKKFNVSLVMLTILTTTVMAVIGNNVALSLGMVGALSIVRFRTAVKDSRDTAYIFWAIVAGISCGAGDYVIGAVGSAAIFLLLLLLGRVKNDNRILLIIRGAREKEGELESLVFTRFLNKATLRVKNTTEDSIELIYEIPRKQYSKTVKNTQDLLSRFYSVGGVAYVNIVAQNDEII